MPRHRLGLVLADVESQDPSELEALLIALTAAAWPTPSALDQ